MSTQTFLVTGATGKQGGSVARNLLSSNCAVHALVRDPTSAASLALQSLGANLFRGTWDDIPAITAAAKSCTGLFLNVFPSFVDDGELRHARNILAAGKTTGIKHVIYTSSAGTGEHERLSNWNPKSMMGSYYLSKTAVEEEVRNGGWETWTIFRPGYFMTNFLLPDAAYMFPDLATEQVFECACSPDTKLMLVDPADVGRFTTAAFLDPRRYGGKVIPIFVEKMAIGPIVEALSKTAGKEIHVKYHTAEEIAEMSETNPLVASQIIMKELTELVDGGAARECGIPMTSFSQFLNEEQEKIRSTIGGQA